MSNDKIDFVLVGDDDGPSNADVRLAEEIGRHAASEAIGTIQRVLNTCPNNVLPAATAVAHAVLEWSLAQADEQLDAVTPGFVRVVEELKATQEKHGGARFRAVAEKLRSAIYGRAI